MENETQRKTESELGNLLKQNPFVVSLLELDETDSTNRVAKEAALDGAPEGTLVTAKRQSMGKGRLGRSFFSPEGGIYMSMILRPGIPAEQAVLITTCAAVAVARAIEKVSGVSAGIKWVNDIFVKGKKVCGILAEAGWNAETGQLDYVILGIGINVERQSVPEELKDIVGCLEEYTEVSVAKNALIAAVWDEFANLYETLSTAVYMEDYKERSVLMGREVTVYAPEGNYRGVVKDIDREGHLVVEHQGELRVLSSGEISVRL